LSDSALGGLGLTDEDYEVGLGVIGGLGIAIDMYRRRRAFDELGRQYELSARLFAAARHRLLDESWPVHAVLIPLGREALMEDGEWQWMRRSQPRSPKN
jgi:hypothetical protein